MALSNKLSLVAFILSFQLSNFIFTYMYYLKVMESHECYQLVFSSSCTVYGEPETLPITENHETGKVTNVYGRTKYFIEEMLKDISLADQVNRKIEF